MIEVLGTGRTTYGKDEGDAAANSFGAVEDSSFAQPELLLARCSLPARHSGAKQPDLDALAGGKHGRDGGIVIRGADLGLRGQPRRRGQGGGLVGSINHGCWRSGRCREE